MPIGTNYVEDGHKVTICHRTGSATGGNTGAGYSIITVDVAAIDGEGASDHDGHNQTGNGPDGDVIPPVAGFNDDGKNWNNNWGPDEAGHRGAVRWRAVRPVPQRLGASLVKRRPLGPIIKGGSRLLVGTHLCLESRWSFRHPRRSGTHTSAA